FIASINLRFIGCINDATLTGRKKIALISSGCVCERCQSAELLYVWDLAAANFALHAVKLIIKPFFTNFGILPRIPLISGKFTGKEYALIFLNALGFFDLPM
ncbi:unnamed protein product, partial [Larinioides sclopetarius]